MAVMSPIIKSLNVPETIGKVGASYVLQLYNRNLKAWKFANYFKQFVHVTMSFAQTF